MPQGLSEYAHLLVNVFQEKSSKERSINYGECLALIDPAKAAASQSAKQ